MIPVKITRVCYTCSKCGLVAAYEEQPCPLCASRALIVPARVTVAPAPLLSMRLLDLLISYCDFCGDQPLDMDTDETVQLWTLRKPLGTLIVGSTYARPTILEAIERAHPNSK